MRRGNTRSCVPVLWWDHLALEIFKSFLDNELREGVFRTFGIPKPKRIFHGSSSLGKTTWHREGATIGGCCNIPKIQPEVWNPNPSPLFISP
jgi:hypothetical protein